MAQVKIISTEFEAGAFEGVSGVGLPLVSGEALFRGDLVTAGGVKASAADATKLPIGYVGMATGRDSGKVADNQTFRSVAKSLVYMDTTKPVGTPIYLSNTAGEFADVAGTVKVIVGYYIADSEGHKVNSDMAVMDIRPIVNA